MIDMLDIIYQNMIRNETINKHCKNRIKYYHYDETADTSGPYILIDPLIAPQPSTFASDVNLTTEYLYQIDVRSNNYKLTKEIQEAIREVMKTIGFYQQDGIDDYDEKMKRFLDGRRYRGNPYTIDGLRHIDSNINN